MAQNNLPNSLKKLFALGEDMADGLHNHEVAVGILHNLEAVFRPALTAAQAANTAFGTARVVLRDANAVIQTADDAGKELLKNCRRVFESHFGEQFNLDWEAAGWPNNSTTLPSTQDERFTLLGDLKAYFTANPAREVAPLGVTAANLNTKFQAISDAREDRGDQETASGNARDARDAAVANLRKKMRGLIDELSSLLSDEDNRWHQFGLSRPADPETPAVPEGLVLQNGPGHTILGGWERALRADRYRVFRLIVGVDTEFVYVETVEDEDATLAGFTAGQVVRVRVTAANDAGESLPSVEVEITVT